MSKHVLFIHDNRTSGGVGNVASQLAAGLQMHGWSVDDVHLRDPRPSAARALLHLVRRRGLVLATQNFSAAYTAAALAYVVRRPWVVWVHGPVGKVIEAAGTSQAKQRLMKSVYHRAPLVVCNSDATLKSFDDFQQARAPIQRVEVIRNSAGPQFFASGATAVEPARPELGFVGRLSAEKQPMLLLDTLRVLPMEYRLCIVGEGPLSHGIAAEGRSAIADGRLRLAGAVPVGPQTYRQWAVTLLCSAYEGYALALLESLASGVPVVSTPIPAAMEMLARHAPYMLARDGTPEALAQAIQQVLALDPRKVAKDIETINAEHRPELFAARWDALLTTCLHR